MKDFYKKYANPIVAAEKTIVAILNWFQDPFGTRQKRFLESRQYTDIILKDYYDIKSISDDGGWRVLVPKRKLTEKDYAEMDRRLERINPITNLKLP